MVPPEDFHRFNRQRQENWPATLNATLPKVITSLATASAWVMRAPFRKVPFDEPRSLTRTPVAVSEISACRREMVGS